VWETSLKEIKVVKTPTRGDKIIVEVAINRRDKCPYYRSGRLYKHGKCKAREVLHTWINGKSG